MFGKTGHNKSYLCDVVMLKNVIFINIMPYIRVFTGIFLYVFSLVYIHRKSQLANMFWVSHKHTH